MTPVEERAWRLASTLIKREERLASVLKHLFPTAKQLFKAPPIPQSKAKEESPKGEKVKHG